MEKMAGKTEFFYESGLAEFFVHKYLFGSAGRSGLWDYVCESAGPCAV